MPNGKELKSFRKSLNEEGAVEGNVDLSMNAITGSYTLEVYSSNDVLLASQNFMVEEFVPDRIKVTTKLDKEFLKAGDKSNWTFMPLTFLDLRLPIENTKLKYR
jgi:uncharacterized protein YfaS (alpha-2-macroglobulin family)